MTFGAPPRVLIVAGSDSGGGAGIQGDIKTVSALGGYAATAITAITVQDTKRVYDVTPISAEIVQRQMQVVLADIGADAVKTGMIGDEATVAAVAEAYRTSAGAAPLVVDPVMVATSGDALAREGVGEALHTHLIPLATIVTPNIPEAEALTDGRIHSVNGMIEAGRSLLALGPSAVLVKGGHLPGETITDVLVEQGRSTPSLFQDARIENRNTHGTGCALASAIATELGRGCSIGDAIETARAFVRRAIAAGPGFGEGAGPLGHGAASP
ncbi:MAG: bifunctional hydroxymethylpyrimidine kinase/phosphomethylpyrimidine kinase [Pseudomonadota bacterium]